MHKFTLYNLNNVIFTVAIFFVLCSCTNKNSSICDPPRPTKRDWFLTISCGHNFPSCKVFLIGPLGHYQLVLRCDWGPWAKLCMVGCFYVSTLLNFKIPFLKRYVSQTQQGIFCIAKFILDPTACKIGIYVTFVAFLCFGMCLTDHMFPQNRLL